MNLIDLRYFSDAVALGSIKLAADLNFVSSPAISTAIRRLEQDLNLELLQHKKNQFVPNEKGLLLFEEAKKIFSQVEHSKSLLKSPTEIEGTWTIGTQQSLAQTYFPKILKYTKEKYPNLKLIIRTGTTSKNIEELESGKIDSAILVSNVNVSNYESVSLKKGFFHIYGTKQKQSNFYLTEDTPETRRLIRAYKKEFGIELEVTSRISSWNTNKLFAEAGLGLTYIPDYLESKKLVRKYSGKKALSQPYEILSVAKKDKAYLPKSQALVEVFKKIVL